MHACICAWADYTSSSVPTSVIIPVGETQVCFNGVIIDDDEPGEGTESFTLNITEVSPSDITITRETTEVIILDNDCKLRLKLSLLNFI